MYLEALAAGTPCIGSVLDGCREALRDGALGDLVDPRDHEMLLNAIRNNLKAPKKVDKKLLDYFSIDQFNARVTRYLTELSK